jgi:hypothetical protein
MTALKLDLGIDPKDVDAMQRTVDLMERANDAIGNRRIRHAINQRLIEIRLFLRDGQLE